MKFKFYTNLLPFFIANIFCLQVQAQISELDSAEGIKLFSSVKEACKKLNHNLILNVDLVYYLSNCTLHQITDSNLINNLIQDHDKIPNKISEDIYASLPIGNIYTYTDYYAEFPPTYNKFSPTICKKFNDTIVSLDNYNYYYIEGCKKRKFKNYSDVEVFNNLNNSIQAISNYELSNLPDGKPIPTNSVTKNIKEISESDLKKTLPSKYILCKNVNNKITAFFDSYFYVEKCILLPISNFSIALQMKAEERGGVRDLSIEQVLGLEQGKKISEKEVMKKINHSTFSK